MKQTYFKIRNVSRLLGAALLFGTLSTNSWSQQAKQNTDQKRYQEIKQKPASVTSNQQSFGPVSQPVEAVEKRAKNAKHFRNADGTYTAQIGGNYHYKDENGKWQDIDLTIETGATGFKSVKNDVKSYFPQQAGTNGVSMKLENGSEFTWWKNPQFRIVSNGNTVVKKPAAVSGTVSNEKLTYSNLYANISEEFVMLNGGMENNIVLHSMTPELSSLSSGAALEFSQFIPLQSNWKIFNAAGKAMTANFETTDFSVQMGNADSKIYFGRVVVFDNAISKDEAMLIHAPADKLSASQKQQLEQSVYTITYKVRFVNGGVEIISTLPASWIQAAGRSFPVTIDPTVTITPTASTGNFYGPMTHWYGFQRHASLYLQSEIGVYGTITDIEYNSTTTGAAGSRPTKVYMSTTPNATLTGGGLWNSTEYTGGAQLCLDQSTDQGNTTGWKMLNLTTPFIYGQDNLLVMVYDAWGSTGSAKYYNQSASMPGRQVYYRQDNTDPGDAVEMEEEAGRLTEIRITYVPSAVCTGLPATATASSSAAAVCPSIPFTLSLPGLPIESGLSIQWESSTDGGTTWNDFGTAQTSGSYTVTAGQTVATQYRAVITCTPTSDEITSSVVSVAMSPALDCGCTPSTSNCGLDDEIQNVTFAGINNNSTCSSGGYGDYRTSVTPAQVLTGVGYQIDVTTGEGGNESVAVWIDYNQNGVYEMSEYALVGATEGGTVSTTINIPASALAGTTNMRVRAFYAGTGDPLVLYTNTPNSACVTLGAGYGETEDYKVTITAGTDCSGTPDAGTIAASETIVCVNEAITLSSDASNPFIGIEYQWQASVNGGTTWTNVGTASVSTSYTVASQSVETMYRLIATCTVTGDADTSTTVTVDQQVATQCYCINAIPFNCTDGDLITNVTIGTINNNSTCGNTTNGYSDYTTSVAPATVTAGTTVPVSVSVGPSGAGWLYESVGVWIDYNQNGLLDSIEGEYTNVGTGLNQALTANISIPATALSGPTRMRVVVTASITGLHAYVCGPLTATENYGEMEDYTLNIIGTTVAVDSVVVTTQGGVPAAISTPSGTLQLVATVYPLTVSQDVTWSMIPVTGAATISATGLVTAVGNGTVWAKAVSDEDATKADSILITITNQDLGITTLNLSDFSLYPNPATDYITLKSSESHAVLDLTITDVAGKVLFSDKLISNALNDGYQVALGTYSNGVYILRLTGSDTNIQQQIIKK